jgi:hypothetical protein
VILRNGFFESGVGAVTGTPGIVFENDGKLSDNGLVVGIEFLGGTKTSACPGPIASGAELSAHPIIFENLSKGFLSESGFRFQFDGGPGFGAGGVPQASDE